MNALTQKVLQDLTAKILATVTADVPAKPQTAAVYRFPGIKAEIIGQACGVLPTQVDLVNLPGRGHDLPGADVYDPQALPIQIGHLQLATVSIFLPCEHWDDGTLSNVRLDPQRKTFSWSEYCGKCRPKTDTILAAAGFTAGK